MESSVDDTEFYRYFRMYKTIIQMLHDRGYVLDDDERQGIYDEDITFDVFQTLHDNFRPDQLNFILESSDPETSRVSVRFDILDNKVSGKVLTTIVGRMKEESVKHVIIIVKDGSVTSAIAKSIERLRYDSHIKIEYFEQKEVLINITQHDLVPKHEPLTPDEKEELLNRYKINESQLPKILKMDPVVRYFGVDPGTVMKITRRSETAGRYVTYRLVC